MENLARVYVKYFSVSTCHVSEAKGSTDSCSSWFCGENDHFLFQKAVDNQLEIKILLA